ncbi:hypothetical protein BpHYR1_030478 [Brachionus plicatilis]|uniref:Uncharacterized protein n=1 Tax=Brachionus plicatilis TaxID=10195 RepID=A0A3M7P803_BRAPC|nr:hypothetical protein BpHYR1_030478 [Brachionus plicatilis]
MAVASSTATKSRHLNQHCISFKIIKFVGYREWRPLDRQKLMLAVLMAECKNKPLKNFKYENLIEKRIEEKRIFPSRPSKRPTSNFDGLVAATHGTQHYLKWLCEI